MLGEGGTAFGYALTGGLAVAGGGTGARAGLGQSGGDLVLVGTIGPLAGERQSGGRLFAVADRIGPHASRGRRGGRFIRLSTQGLGSDGQDAAADRAAVIERLEPLRPWLPARI